MAKKLVKMNSDFGIYSDTPFLDRFQKTLTRILNFFFLNYIAIIVRDLVFSVLIILLFTYQLRLLSKSIFADINREKKS